MKRWFLVLAVLLSFAGHSKAQVNSQLRGAGAPTGSCTSTQTYLDTTAHIVYFCNNAAWVAAGPTPNSTGSISSGSGAPTGACTANALYVDSATGNLYSCNSGTWFLAGGGGSGSGTVTSFSAGTLSPLFTTSVATATSTPALSFALSNFAAHSFYGNGTTGSAAPAASLIGASDYSPNVDCVTTGSVNVMVCAPAQAVTAYTAGLELNVFTNVQTTSTTPTIAVSGLSAQTIKRYGAQALVSGDMLTTMPAKLIYDGTAFELMNPQTGNVPFSVVSAANVTASAGAGTFKSLSCGTVSSASCVITLTGTTSGTTTITGPAVAGTTTNPVAFTNAISTPFYQTATNCAAVGTAASPSVASCTAAPAGHFSCATNATGATCQVNTTAVTANSEIFVFESDAAATGTALGVTCNTGTTVNPTTRLLATQTAGASFTINLGTVTTNPACFSYLIIN